MAVYPNLPRPFFVLAPMYDVADTVFRQIVADLAVPDLFVTEFVNVDALNSMGREHALKHLRFSGNERPLIAQIWGTNPENFYKTAQELAGAGFAGIDINMGCPAKEVLRNGCCCALVENREKALEIIQATTEGTGGKVPVSVKTRLGLKQIDFTWHELLLSQNLSMLTVHGRTARQMSQGKADWDSIGHVRELRDRIAPQTLLVGNGDVTSRDAGLELAEHYGLDGVMIGRGIFHDPFVFAKNSPWANYSKEQRIALYAKHVKLFAGTWRNGERRVETLNKFCKVYINGFEGASQLREQLMKATSTDDLLDIMSHELKSVAVPSIP